MWAYLFWYIDIASEQVFISVSYYLSQKYLSFIIIPGLLLNINYCTTGGDNFQLVLRLLSTVLDTDTVDLVVEYCQSAKANNGIKPSMTPQDQEHLITAQQLALEILSNFCCPDGKHQKKKGWKSFIGYVDFRLVCIIVGSNNFLFFFS